MLSTSLKSSLKTCESHASMSCFSLASIVTYRKKVFGCIASRGKVHLHVAHASEFSMADLILLMMYLTVHALLNSPVNIT